MNQFCVTTAMGKRLIGQGMARHPEVQQALDGGTLVIIAGTTNGYVAEEVLASIGQAEGFSRVGFRRGVTVAPGAKLPKVEFPGDVVIVDGKWQPGQTIFDVAEDLRAGDLVLKGANAVDPGGVPAVQILHPQGGTIVAAVAALIGRRVGLIAPVGVEKRVSESVHVLSQRCNAPGAKGARLFPFPGRVFTELDAINLLTGAEATLLACGSVWDTSRCWASLRQPASGMRRGTSCSCGVVTGTTCGAFPEGEWNWASGPLMRSCVRCARRSDWRSSQWR